MKLSRPAMATAAALAIAAGSVNVAHSDPTGTDGADGADVAAPAPAAPGTELGEEIEALRDALASGADNVNAETAQDMPAGGRPKTITQVRPLLAAPPSYKNPEGITDPSNEKYVGQDWFNYTGGKTYTVKEDGKDVVREYPKTVDAYEVFSPSMDRWIPVAVIPATRNGEPVENAPTLYLLNGAGGSEQNADWVTSGQAGYFFRDKGVNVVIPMEGAFSYYIDWLTDGEELKEKSHYFKGAQKWTTFLGQELQPTIEDKLGANGVRGVLGMSMSATSSLLLAEHFPREYAAVGSFSGCAATSTPAPSFFAGLTINRAASNPGALTPAHAWGPMGSPYNRYNDALVNADKLAGSNVYISNASGLAAKEDMYGHRTTPTKEGGKGQTPAHALKGSATTIVEGGVIEGATNACTHDLRAKIEAHNRGAGEDLANKINAQYVFRNTGTHMWDLWKDDMKRSWNMTFGPTFFGEGNFIRAEDTELMDIKTWNPEGSS